MVFPDELLRGIPNATYIEDDYPASNLFYPDSSEVERADGCRELSVNWRDDEGAVNLLFAQKKADGSTQFKGGAAVLSRGEVDRLRSNPILRQQLNYERQPTAANTYHGNLLLKNPMSKGVIRKIAAGIALCVTCVLSDPEAEGH